MNYLSFSSSLMTSLLSSRNSRLSHLLSHHTRVYSNWIVVSPAVVSFVYRDGDSMFLVVSCFIRRHTLGGARAHVASVFHQSGVSGSHISGSYRG